VIFLDTSFLYPLFNAEDLDHSRVKKVFEEYRGQRLNELLVTTPQVIFETITLVRTAQRDGKPPADVRHRNAVHVGERLFAGKLARIHRPTEDDERTAFQYFRKHADQVYSMVDCMSFLVMDQLGITEALAVDRDFTHRFVARPGPRPK